MWYCRRRPEPDEEPGKFNPARDSVMDPHSAAETGPPVPVRILSMDNPAAWRESYSAASPRELDSHQIQAPKGPPNKRDMSAREGAFNESVSGLSSHTESCMTASSYSLGDASTMAGDKTREEAVRESVVARPTRYSIHRKSLPHVAELPG